MNPYPFNEKLTSAELPLGEWHTSQWKGAKVELKDLLKHTPIIASNKLHEIFKIVKTNFS